MLIDKLKAKLKKPKPSKSIEQLDLTVRTYTILKRAGIDSTDDLIRLRWKDLTRIRGIVRKSCEEVERVLSEMGLGLREE